MVPDISVVTIVKDGQFSIERTLDSVSSQIDVCVEHVIVDGGSSDLTLQIIKSKLPHSNIQRSVVSEPDRGIYDALNKGIARCTAQFIAILHSGDMYNTPDSLKKVIDAFSQEPGCDFVYADAYFYDKSGNLSRFYKSYRAANIFINFGIMPAHTTLVIRKEAMAKIGSYNSDYKIAGDFDYFLRLFREKEINFKYMKMPLVAMSAGGISTSGLRSKIIIYLEKRKCMKLYNYYFVDMRLLLRYLVLPFDYLYYFFNKIFNRIFS